VNNVIELLVPQRKKQEVTLEDSRSFSSHFDEFSSENIRVPLHVETANNVELH
jgi:hypothetical protein